jgi:hypothetical protein
VSVPPTNEEGIEVIDLTEPEMLEPIDQDAPATGDDLAGLPVRVPGLAFAEDEPTPSVVAGESGGSLRSALIDYNRGRAEAGELGDTNV